MSYQVLARKWRPKNFQELVGQEHVLQPLVNALKSQRLHHAYLFTGTRGVGKTTIARILARCLNCEKGITAEPCGQCTACEDISQGRFIDLIEVDAASRTKVEDTRDLLDNVQYAPTRGRFKVYLIDEVHMLSNHSFNALLKTLEEPPPHVKFLLATTDPQRLPVTILSRCLQFHLKNLAPEIISQHLQTILVKENIQAEPQALAELAKSANGSVRDALSLLDQTIAFCQGAITLAAVRSLLGTIDQQFLYDLLNALITRNGQQVLTIIQQMAELNADFSQALDALLSLLHQIAVYQLVDIAPTHQDEKTAYFSRQVNAEDIQLFYQIGLIGRRDLPLAPSMRIGFEMTLLRMLAFYPGTASQYSATFEPVNVVNNPPDSIKQLAIKPTSSLPKQTPVAPPEPKLAEVENSLSHKIAEQNTASQINPCQSEAVQDWSHLLSQLNLTGMVAGLASHCVLQSWQEHRIEFILAPKHKPLLNEKVLERFTQALQNYYQRPIKVDIKIGESEQLSPAEQLQQAQQARQQQARINLEQDVHVQTIISQFNAKLVSSEPIVNN